MARTQQHTAKRHPRPGPMWEETPRSTPTVFPPGELAPRRPRAPPQVYDDELMRSTRPRPPPTPPAPRLVLFLEEEPEDGPQQAQDIPD